MAENDWKKRLGMVYSTNPDFSFTISDGEDAVDTLQADRQNLRVGIDRKARAGKQVTVVDGFVGSDDDLQDLGRTLKTRCGVGGSVKDGQIIIQGDFRDRVVTLLVSMGYTRTKRSN